MPALPPFSRLIPVLFNLAKAEDRNWVYKGRSCLTRGASAPWAGQTAGC